MKNRSEYQREYYKRRKQLALCDKPESVEIKLGQKPKLGHEYNKSGHSCGKIRYIYLIFAIFSTCWLIHESSTFYVEQRTMPSQAYVKALLTEFGILMASILGFESKVALIGKRMLVAGFVILSAYSLVAPKYNNYKLQQLKSINLKQEKELLTKAINQQSNLIDYYSAKDWPSTITKINNYSISLSNKLKSINNTIDYEYEYKLYDLLITIGLRVLIQLLNILVIKQIIDWSFYYEDDPR